MNKRTVILAIALATGIITSLGNLKEVQAADAVQNSNVTKITGWNCVEVGTSVSQAGWDESDSIIMTSSDDFPDALSGTTLGIQLNAPIIFNAEVSLDPKYTESVRKVQADLRDKTYKEIDRLKAKKVYILGGIGSVSQKTEDYLRNNNFDVVRLCGKDRFDTAVAVGQEVISKSKSNTVFLSNAYGFADALAGSTFAGKTGSPILLTGKDELNESTKKALGDWNIKNVTILGGTGVISEGISKKLSDMGISVSRLGGADRYATALKIVQNFAPSSSGVTVATGKDYKDALCASVYSYKTNKPIMLYDYGCGTDVTNFLKEKELTAVGNEIFSVSVDNLKGNKQITATSEKRLTGDEILNKSLELGFCKAPNVDNAVKYNKYGPNGSINFDYASLCSYNGKYYDGTPTDNEMGFFVNGSDAEFDEKIKLILNWILPTEGSNLYKILDDPRLYTNNRFRENGAADWQKEQYDLFKSYGFEVVLNKESNRENLVTYMDGRRVQIEMSQWTPIKILFGNVKN
ncbi:cell wall-binding repeat-containing protein [Clostridium magnum]|uniref:N-acetylmuramoyl-L-alanine amidase LytC n=1 Tax=Clostridium magnum DSM 2767 TaxID=1121326 RepID=A0A162RR89_9CLOT|nr:cell wall-binding repeat-containing protein [Clostridium magnum]KZL90270.1 N-acetylmuramoyl-L-alanine amidase LytC precursor [Clostridium magnum DSM 2767]SHH80661.1 Putative cell wall-binding protein [Clostridium magnum DSM 2767]